MFKDFSQSLDNTATGILSNQRVLDTGLCGGDELGNYGPLYRLPPNTLKQDEVLKLKVPCLFRDESISFPQESKKFNGILFFTNKRLLIRTTIQFKSFEREFDINELQIEIANPAGLIKLHPYFESELSTNSAYIRIKSKQDSFNFFLYHTSRFPTIQYAGYVIYYGFYKFFKALTSGKTDLTDEVNTYYNTFDASVFGCAMLTLPFGFIILTFLFGILSSYNSFYSRLVPIGFLAFVLSIVTLFLSWRLNSLKRSKKIRREIEQEFLMEKFSNY